MGCLVMHVYFGAQESYLDRLLIQSTYQMTDDDALQQLATLTLPFSIPKYILLSGAG
jgi:hypothetical protein